MTSDNAPHGATPTIPAQAAPADPVLTGSTPPPPGPVPVPAPQAGPAETDRAETDLRERARALRRAGHSRRSIREQLGIRSEDRLGRLLQGEPPPEWTRRPRAKDHLRARARELRLEGRTYDEISAELDVSKSSVSLWVRDLPRPAPRMTPEEKARHMNEVRWEPLRRERDAERRAVKAAAHAEIGQLSERELFMIGVALYWAEGAKDKAYDRREAVGFINSDPGVVHVYLAWLRLLGVEESRWRLRVHIHETADIEAAERYWAELAGFDPAALQRTTVKRHNPATNRRNTGSAYRGCLFVKVLDAADLYRRIEGWWCGIVSAVEGQDLGPAE
ncbi:hypothetical protein [Streptomyces sp. NPDC001380]|uniref:hypothetical protein n=1 Tax=Streptomyces sp. NPDC001380 TaxID=3364566 RepID=UPI0036BEAEE4